MVDILCVFFLISMDGILTWWSILNSFLCKHVCEPLFWNYVRLMLPWYPTLLAWHCAFGHDFFVLRDNVFIW